MRWLPLFVLVVVATLIFVFCGSVGADAVLRAVGHVAMRRDGTMTMMHWDMLQAMVHGAKAHGMILSALAFVSVLKQCRVQ